MALCFFVSLFLSMSSSRVGLQVGDHLQTHLIQSRSRRLRRVIHPLLPRCRVFDDRRLQQRLALFPRRAR